MIAATTQDHYPPSCFFRDRAWPEGFVFPACQDCNSATRHDENLLSLVLRFTIHPHNEDDLKEFRKCLNAVKNNFPGLLEAMKLTANQKREVIRKYELKRPFGALVSDLPAVKFPERAAQAIERFMFKLGCALHYKHVGKPLPAKGQVVQAFQTNVSLIDQPLSEELLSSVPSFAQTMRSGQRLDDQFAYRFNASPELEAGIFVCVIRKSFVVILITTGNPQMLEEQNEYDPSAGVIEVENYLRTIGAS